MAVQPGIDVVLEVNTGTEASPTWSEFLPAVNNELSIDCDPLDITTKGDAGWKNFLPGLKSWSIAIEGQFDRADAALLYMENALLTGTPIIQVRIRSKTTPTDKFTAKALIQGLKYGLPVDGSGSISGSLQGKGPLVKTA